MSLDKSGLIISVGLVAFLITTRNWQGLINLGDGIILFLGISVFIIWTFFKLDLGIFIFETLRDWM